MYRNNNVMDYLNNMGLDDVDNNAKYYISSIIECYCKRPEDIYLISTNAFLLGIAFGRKGKLVYEEIGRT